MSGTARDHLIARRDFLRASGILCVGAAMAPFVGLAQDSQRVVRPMAVTPVGEARIPFPRMGIHGLDFHEGGRANAFAILERALELDVKYFDTSAAYGRSHEGEIWLGEVMEGRRSDAVIATGTHRRDAAEAERVLDESLRRLRTDYVDVWKIEAVATLEDLDRATAPGGVLEVARAALSDGRARLLCLYGYSDPTILRRFIEAVPEAAVVQCPVNCLDPHFKSFINEVLPVARERNMAVVATHDLALDSIELGFLITPREARVYTLSQPITTWLPQIRTVAELEECALLAKTYIPLDAAQQEELLERSAIYGGPAFEFYKRGA